MVTICGHHQPLTWVMTFAFSFLITLIAHVEGIRRRGVKEYLKAFVTPDL